MVFDNTFTALVIMHIHDLMLMQIYDICFIQWAEHIYLHLADMTHGNRNTYVQTLTGLRDNATAIASCCHNGSINS